MERKIIVLGVVIFLALLAFLSLLGEEADRQSVGSATDILTTTQETSPFRALGTMIGSLGSKGVGSATSIVQDWMKGNQTQK